MSVIKQHTFQNAAIETGNGTELAITFNYDDSITLVFEITGTSDSRTVVFEGAGISGNYVACLCTNVTSGATASQTTASGEIYRVNLTGLSKFRTRLSAIAGEGANISVKGTLVG